MEMVGLLSYPIRLFYLDSLMEITKYLLARILYILLLCFILY